MMVIAITNSTTTLTCGSCWPRRMLPKIQSGSVFCAPAVNVVTIDLVERQREREQAAGDERGGDHRAA